MQQLTQVFIASLQLCTGFTVATAYLHTTSSCFNSSASMQSITAAVCVWGGKVAFPSMHHCPTFPPHGYFVNYNPQDALQLGQNRAHL